MTGAQKIISAKLKGQGVSSGERIYIRKNDITDNDSISFSDKFCGVYGALYLENEVFEVPASIFADLGGALRNDVTSEEIAEYIYEYFIRYKGKKNVIEFGGDSLSYLNADDRLAVCKKLSALGFFAVLFECDYISVEYAMEKTGKRPHAFYNDGPESYELIISLNLSEV